MNYLTSPFFQKCCALGNIWASTFATAYLFPVIYYRWEMANITFDRLYLRVEFLRWDVFPACQKSTRICLTTSPFFYQIIATSGFKGTVRASSFVAAYLFSTLTIGSGKGQMSKMGGIGSCFLSQNVFLVCQKSSRTYLSLLYFLLSMKNCLPYLNAKLLWALGEFWSGTSCLCSSVFCINCHQQTSILSC